MNRFAYLTTKLAVKTLANLSNVNINTNGEENIPDGSIIFVINHFTRVETLFLPYKISQITGVPVWSLASDSLFKGALATILDNLGAVSTRDPDRDLLVVKTLLSGEANWVIFPEGLMVKNKKIVEKGQFMLSYAGIKHPPHTGAATLAIRTEFYRQRLKKMSENNSDEANRLLDIFNIDSVDKVLEKKTYIVPVNITYYPLRSKENMISDLMTKYVDNITTRMMEEVLIESTMLLSGVDIDIRFGKAIDIEKVMHNSAINRDISSDEMIDFDDPISSRGEMRKVAFKVMQMYMAAIYSMTTVNYDHIFASLLKLMPRKKITENDLRERVYLIAQFAAENLDINMHRNIKTEFTKLLTDDNCAIYNDFVEIALEKKCIKKDGRFFIKDFSKFYSHFGFHSVRLESPVSVMANEVEPLKSLLRYIRKIAWLPRFLIKRKILNNFQKKTLLSFEQDYSTFYIEDESKSKEIGKPFLLKGRSNKIGVVLVHGYMAAPMEIKQLALYLSSKGIWVYAPRLKGHGTSPDDLAQTTYLDWIKSVEEACCIMGSICDKIVIGGFSTGAGLALDLAARAKDVCGVFAVCPPMKLQDISAKLVPAVNVWNKFMSKVKIDAGKKEFVENDPENPHINYVRNPISGVIELGRLMDSIGPRLPSVNVPALVIQANNDPVVNQKGSKKIFELLGSDDKMYILYNFDRHGILLGEGSEKVFRSIFDFIRHLEI